MAADEKDRLGNKLREVERAREDLYFAEQDRKLLEKLRSAKDSETDEALKEAAARGRCPKCGARLQSQTLHNVTVEECPTCHGVWVDHDALQELGKSEHEGWVARWLRYEFRK